MLKIRRFHDRIILNIGIPYLRKTVFIFRRGPEVNNPCSKVHTSLPLWVIHWNYISIDPFYHVIMMTPSNIFRVTGPLWGNSSVTNEFPLQRPETQSFDAFFDLRLNKRSSKQSGRRWFQMPSRSLWRHCNDWLRYNAIVPSTSHNIAGFRYYCDDRRYSSGCLIWKDKWHQHLR